MVKLQKRSQFSFVSLYGIIKKKKNEKSYFLNLSFDDSILFSSPALLRDKIYYVRYLPFILSIGRNRFPLCFQLNRFASSRKGNIYQRSSPFSFGFSFFGQSRFQVTKYSPKVTHTIEIERLILTTYLTFSLSFFFLVSEKTLLSQIMDVFFFK